MDRLQRSCNKACCTEQVREHRKSDRIHYYVPVGFQESELNYVNNAGNNKILALTSATVIRISVNKITIICSLEKLHSE